MLSLATPNNFIEIQKRRESKRLLLHASTLIVITHPQEDLAFEGGHHPIPFDYKKNTHKLVQTLSGPFSIDVCTGITSTVWKGNHQIQQGNLLMGEERWWAQKETLEIGKNQMGKGLQGKTTKLSLDRHQEQRCYHQGQDKCVVHQGALLEMAGLRGQAILTEL
nr:hypothetical protein Iba_scaffold1421CG0610 [Ipomoea batatas]